MKKYTRVLFLLISFCVSASTIKAQSIPKAERATVLVPNLIIKDSLFLCGLDSLIFNSICPEIKENRTNNKIFDVWSRKNNDKTNSYTLDISLSSMVQIYKESDLKGCFTYKNYLFLWFYDIPKELLDISSEKKKLTYIKGIPHIAIEHTQFTFDYSEKKLKLIGICCY